MATEASQEQGRPGDPVQGESPLSTAAASDLYEDRPELFVGAAFIGGFALARILKLLGP
jgi:hypothetical protein